MVKIAQIDKKSLFNLIIRGSSVLSRFVLLFCLGRYFTTEDLGNYGIFYTSISLGILLLGVDFYTFANRELLYADDGKKLTVIRNQFLFYIVTYLIFLLPFVLLFTYDVLPIKYIVFFYFIIIFDHISQEFYRLFTILSYPVFANWLLFLRNGIWVIMLIAIFLIFKISDYSLSYVFSGWLIGSALSIVLALTKVYQLYGKEKLDKVNINWFLNGLKVCSLYFSSTIALISIEHLNRYLIKYWCGISKLGVFTFFSQIANFINVVIFTLFIMVIYPKLVEAVNLKNWDNYNSLKDNLNKKVIFYSIIIGVLLIFLIYPMIYSINKSEYYSYLPTYFLLVLANIFLNISSVYHYTLYALKKDSFLFYSTLIGALFSVTCNVILIQYFSILGASIALLASYIALLVSKIIFLKKAEAKISQQI